VSGERDPQAPERYVPEEHGPLPAYEHVHRYALAAAGLGPRNRVLDLGSGSGHGSRILRESGARVVALDLDAASLRREPPGVRARAEALPFGDASFDAVVCFETLEHLAEPAALLAEAARVLRREGALLLSTPDREVYTERARNRNPHHLRELDQRELAALLGAHFSEVRLYAQSVWAGSWIAPLAAVGGPGARRLRALRRAAPGAQAPCAPWADPADARLPVPLFLLAVCSRSRAGAERIARRLGGESLLHDPAQSLLGHYLGSLEGLQGRDRQIAEFAAHARNLERLRDESRARVASLEQHCDNLERAVKRWEAQALALGEHAGNLEERLREREERVAGLEAHAGNLERLREEREAYLAELERHARGLEERVAGLEAHAANLESHRDGLRAHAENVEARVRALEAELARGATRAAELEAELRATRACLDALRARRPVRWLRRAGLLPEGLVPRKP
jgi:SAM-dependent methyltransferase